MKHLILLIFFAVSCGRTQNSETGELEPFEISITSYDYAAAYGLQYLLTNEEFKIVFKSDIEGERDSILFNTIVELNEKLRTLGSLDLDSLKDYYENPCMDDGSQISVAIKKNGKERNVHLSNYYHQDIGLAIELMNSLTPEDFKIWYDRDRLIERQTECENAHAEYEQQMNAVKPSNHFDQESEFQIISFDQFSDYPSSDPDASNCSNWSLTQTEIERILTETTRISGQEWHILFSHLPCVYRGTLSQHETNFKFEINGGSWLTISSDTTIYYADLGATLSKLFLDDAWQEGEGEE